MAGFIETVMLANAMIFSDRFVDAGGAGEEDERHDGDANGVSL